MGSGDESRTTASDRLETDEVDKKFASAFNQETDPLAQYSDQFQDLPDPFEYFIANVLNNRDSIEDPETLDHYRRTYRQWRKHIQAITANRHPACPNPKHVQRFIEWRRDVHANNPQTIKGKLSRLTQAYEYWQEKSNFPHPPDWNPFTLARKETRLGKSQKKDHYVLSLSNLRSVFRQTANIRRRAIIGLQLKQGLRAGEVCNLRLSDINISHSELQTQYPELGTHRAFGEHKGAIYIPHDRDGNKSSNPRLIPVDDELRWLLLRHLLTRPQVNEPWAFLSRRTFTKMVPQGVNKEWKTTFHPEYAETDQNAPITSHYGRHWFSSYCRLAQEMEREQVQYLRGDRVQPLNEFPSAIDDYLHPNYALIEEPYRKHIFKLNIRFKHTQLD
ncbi:tyrosine-type recombinase/integrase [Haloarcula sp. NS06]|uniref:tyrosine-type recombinase/integrase n=1 Tax=Haloarcula sp. NS06 TaxID=3409688 RepID=UPI003DA6D223